MSARILIRFIVVASWNFSLPVVIVHGRAVNRLINRGTWPVSCVGGDRSSYRFTLASSTKHARSTDLFEREIFWLVHLPKEVAISLSKRCTCFPSRLNRFEINEIFSPSPFRRSRKIPFVLFHEFESRSIRFDRKMDTTNVLNISALNNVMPYEIIEIRTKKGDFFFFFSIEKNSARSFLFDEFE